MSTSRTDTAASAQASAPDDAADEISRRRHTIHKLEQHISQLEKWNLPAAMIQPLKETLAEREYLFNNNLGWFANKVIKMTEYIDYELKRAVDMMERVRSRRGPTMVAWTQSTKAVYRGLLEEMLDKDFEDFKESTA